jgi:hypothetical protein
MDKIKEMASKVGHSSSSGTSNTNTGAGAPGTDYGDKGMLLNLAQFPSTLNLTILSRHGRIGEEDWP